MTPLNHLIRFVWFRLDDKLVSDYSLTYDIAVYSIDKFYDELIKALSLAADCAVPRRSRSSRSAAKHWWSEDLDELKLRSINAHNIWKDAGRPRNGPIFDVYKKEKYSYKIAIRNAKFEMDNSISNDLHDALLNKSNNQFWKIWKSRFGSEWAENYIVSEMVDPVRISETFAEYFCNLCKPSSDEINSKLRDKFKHRFVNYVGDKMKQADFFTVELTSKLICELKTGKAPGFDNISTEHLLYCHPSVPVYITYLCNLILLTGHVPSEFGIGVTFPIPKGSPGNKITSVDDFRGITVSPIISKIFEKGILENFGSYLWSSDNQFGFKKKVGCAHAIYCLKTVIDQFVCKRFNSQFVLTRCFEGFRPC